MFQDIIQDALYPVYMPICVIRLLLAVTFSHTFHVFDDLDNFEDYWSQVLWNYRQWGLVTHFYQGYIEIIICQRMTTVAKSLSHHIISRVHTINVTSDSWWWSQSPGWSTEKKGFQCVHMFIYLFHWSLFLLQCKICYYPI